MWKWGYYEGILVYAYHGYELIYFTSGLYKTQRVAYSDKGIEEIIIIYYDLIWTCACCSY